MKRSLYLPVFVLPMILVLASCGSGASEAAKDQARAIETLKKSSSPGEIPTSPTGNYMTFKMNGKPWSASSRFPDFDERSSYFLINYKDGEDFVSFSYSRQRLEAGKSETLKEGSVMQLHLDGDFLEAKEGEISITSKDEHWVEGTFHFTGMKSSDPSYKLEVTDGKFRASLDAATK